MSDRGQRDQMTDPNMAFVVHVYRGQLPTLQKLMHTRPGYPKQPRGELIETPTTMSRFGVPPNCLTRETHFRTFSAFAISLLAGIPAKSYRFCTTMLRDILYNVV